MGKSWKIRWTLPTFSASPSVTPPGRRPLRRPRRDGLQPWMVRRGALAIGRLSRRTRSAANGHETGGDRLSRETRFQADERGLLWIKWVERVWQ